MNTTKIKNVNLVVTKFLRQKIINVKLSSNYLVQLDLRRITSTHFMNMKATKGRDHLESKMNDILGK